MYLDVYAQSYLFALVAAVLITIFSQQRPRIIGAAIMAASWLGVIAAQAASGGLAPTVAFAFIDIFALTAFCVIWVFYQRIWAMWVSVFHTLMLITHLTYEISSPDRFVYLSILTALSYASLAAITVTPLFNWIGLGHHEDFNYRDALPLRRSGFRGGPQRRKTKGKK